MKAVFINEFGDADKIGVRDIADLSAPTGSQVLVKVRAAALNRADLLQRRGLYPPPPGFSPFIPGLEFAGTIVALGDKVADFSVGDCVFGITGGEAQAEFLLIDRSLLVHVPANLHFTEAAAIPEAFITAHDAIFTLGQLKRDENLVIHAVASGVGLAALQLAKANGSFVIGTSRTPDKFHRFEPLGLDKAVVADDLTTLAERLIDDAGNGANVILDLVGAEYFAANLAALAVGGRLILVGLPSGSTATFNLGVALHKRLKLIGTTLRGRSLEEKAAATALFAKDVLPLIADSTIRPNIDQIFPYTDVAAAHMYLESNKSVGKVILEF